MRPLWPSFVFLLLKEAESTAPGGTPTTVAAPNFSSLPPRGEVTASVKPIPVQLQDETLIRCRGSSAPWGMNGWLSAPLDHLIDRSKISKICEESNIVNEDQVTQWLMKFRTPGQSFRGDDLVRGLIRSEHGEELARLFQQMWFLPEFKERAAMMQRALFAEEPTLLLSVYAVWLEAKVTPAEAFRMMPISAKKSADRDLLGAWTLAGICTRLPTQVERLQPRPSDRRAGACWPT
uniref:RxLR effector candidate protein n=2 Tax=Hyaloperonospora arabidopsidis (strain Emoy2) TaxID=559515 RepID=M4BIR1_HYAAE|nr:RxLR effector candidate protein [Hyaloperonospora arabidopsidis Emoy2]